MGQAMWKTAERPVISRVVGDRFREWWRGRSGKHCPLFDIFILTIYGPRRCLMGTRTGTHNRLVSKGIPVTAHHRHTLNLPIPPCGGNDFLAPGPAGGGLATLAVSAHRFHLWLRNAPLPLHGTVQPPDRADSGKGRPLFPGVRTGREAVRGSCSLHVQARVRIAEGSEARCAPLGRTP